MSEEMTLRLEEFNGKEYILADNAIHCIGEHRRINSELHEEIERLNNDIKELLKENSNKEKVIKAQDNIINELEELCKNKYYEKNTTDIDSIAIAGNLYVYMYKKIKELKENNNAKDKR